MLIKKIAILKKTLKRFKRYNITRQDEYIIIKTCDLIVSFRLIRKQFPIDSVVPFACALLQGQVFPKTGFRSLVMLFTVIISCMHLYIHKYWQQLKIQLKLNVNLLCH